MPGVDDQEPSRKPFNEAANVDQQKRLSAYDLSKDEQSKISDLQKERDSLKQEEKQNFNNPDEFKKRFDDKYAELAKNNTPAPENTPQGERRNLPQHQVMQQAAAGVQQDHRNKMHGFDQKCNAGINQVLDRAAQDGRGPQQDQGPEQNQSRDQDRDRDRDR